MSGTLSERVKTSLSKAEKAELEKRAAHEQRSVAWILRKALLAYLNGGK